MKINLFRVLGIALVLCFVLAGGLFGQVDALVNPKYAEQVITVGGPGADLSGYTSEAVQIAVDAIKTRGGGTVKLNPGRFEIIAPIRLCNDINLIGSGDETILHKCNGFRTNYIIDVDWGMLKATVEDPSGFKVGMGIYIFDDRSKNNSGATVAKITDIDGQKIYFDRNSRRDYIASKGGTMSNACSIVEGIGVENVKIANFVIEGNKKNNPDRVNGCLAGGIYLNKSRNCLIESVKITEFNGDLFSWQTTENITVRNCESSYGTALGFHPGMGSDHSIIRNCVSHHNKTDGIYLCWRVQNGIFENNVTYANGRYGISIGHQDTDNIFENNHIYENGSHGVNFRKETEQNSGHRNVFRNNIIENNGISAESHGFYIGGVTHDITCLLYTSPSPRD